MEVVPSLKSEEETHRAPKIVLNIYPPKGMIFLSLWFFKLIDCIIMLTEYSFNEMEWDEN
jgi:hypothetical protein